MGYQWTLRGPPVPAITLHTCSHFFAQKGAGPAFVFHALTALMRSSGAHCALLCLKVSVMDSFCIMLRARACVCVY